MRKALGDDQQLLAKDAEFSSSAPWKVAAKYAAAVTSTTKFFSR